MFAQLKTKITKWWQNQISVLPVDPANDFPDKEQAVQSGLVQLLPRQCYFESYKTYPLSIGKDINKVAQIDARQISPYKGSSWHSALIVKQKEQYLVYYFVLLPKYQAQLDKSTPLLVVPETANSLISLSKASGQATSEQTAFFSKDSNGVWLSNLSFASSAQDNFELSSLTPATLSAFFNRKALERLKGKFTRWQQVKWLALTGAVTAVYLAIASGYLAGMNWYLENKADQTRTVIRDVFRLDGELKTLGQREQEFAAVYAESSELSGPIQLIESYYQHYELEVKAIEIKGQVVVLDGTANNANGLLEKILASPQVPRAEFRSDIKKTGRSQAREKFELEFVWESKLWQQQ